MIQLLQKVKSSVNSCKSIFTKDKNECYNIEIYRFVFAWILFLFIKSAEESSQSLERSNESQSSEGSDDSNIPRKCKTCPRTDNLIRLTDSRMLKMMRDRGQFWSRRTVLCPDCNKKIIEKYKNTLKNEKIKAKKDAKKRAVGDRTASYSSISDPCEYECIGRPTFRNHFVWIRFFVWFSVALSQSSNNGQAGNRSISGPRGSNRRGNESTQNSGSGSNSGRGMHLVFPPGVVPPTGNPSQGSGSSSNGSGDTDQNMVINIPPPDNTSESINVSTGGNNGSRRSNQSGGNSINLDDDDDAMNYGNQRSGGSVSSQAPMPPNPRVRTGTLPTSSGTSGGNGTPSTSGRSTGGNSTTSMNVNDLPRVNGA